MKKHTTSIILAACLGLTACSAAQPAETTATTVAETTQAAATTTAETSAQAAEKTVADDQKLSGKVTLSGAACFWRFPPRRSVPSSVPRWS